MKPWKKNLLIIVGVVVFLVLAIGGIVWSRRGQVVVQSGQVTRRNLTAVVTASGQIEPKNYANVNANNIGKVTDIYVQEGARVKQGQVLLRIQDIQQQADVDAQRAALKASQATLESDEASVASYAANIKTAQADLNQSEAQLAQNKLAYQRGLELLKESLLSKQDFDTRYSNYRVSEATVQSSIAKLAQAKAQYQQAKNTRDMAAADVAQNQASLLRDIDVRNQTIYTSPYPGIITDLPVHEGENVVPGIQNATGSLLFQVSDLSVIDADVMVDETDIASIRNGQKAYITIDALPGKTFHGVVSQIGQTALNSTTGETTTGSSGSNNEAKQFDVKVRLIDPPSVLRPGLSATADIVTATAKQAVSIPIQALAVRTRQELADDKKGMDGKVLAASVAPAQNSNEPPGLNPDSQDVQGVFVIRNSRAIFVPVKTGVMGQMNVQVLSGLKSSDVIVTGSYAALRSLRSGTKIRIDNTPPPQTGDDSSD
jgi:HlyD family secretion protein